MNKREQELNRKEQEGKKKGKGVTEFPIGKLAVVLAVIPVLIMIGIVARHGFSEEQIMQERREFMTGSGYEEMHIPEEKIEDMVILGKVWGYIKYYHPVVTHGGYNWDYELFRILPEYLEVESRDERNALLLEWVSGLGEFQQREGEEPTPENLHFDHDLSWIDESGFSQELISELRGIERAMRRDNTYYMSLHQNLFSLSIKNENPYVFRAHPDAGYRLLTLYRFWNKVEYFFPYGYLIDEEWDDVLREFVPKLTGADVHQEYKLATLELIARAQDTQTDLVGEDTQIENYWGRNYAPLEVTFIEGQAVVTGYHDETRGEETGVNIGDIITKVDGTPVDEMIEERSKYIPASNDASKLREIAEGLLRSRDNELEIEYLSGENIETTTIECFSQQQMRITDRARKDLPPLEMINDEIAYIYMGSLRPEMVNEVMEDIMETEGLIIDLRSFSRDVIDGMGSYLMPEVGEFAKISHADITMPGRYIMEHSLDVGSENADYYQGNVVILVNEYTQGQGELTAMALRMAPRATVVGSTTAGAPVRPTPFELPGNIEIGISGRGIYHPDGTGVQQFGIIPDIEVLPTIEGIRTGLDEGLEKALELIQE